MSKNCRHPPPFINPMTVVTKVDLETGEIKKRPCIDMSRCLNKLVPPVKSTLDSLSVCEKMLMAGDFQSVFDLENMYFHIQLHPDARQFFGFSLPSDNGGKDYFEFTVMCYGYTAAVSTVTRLVKPLKTYLNQLGIRFHIYIDDGRVVAQTQEECNFKAQLTRACFQLAGFNNCLNHFVL